MGGKSSSNVKFLGKKCNLIKIKKNKILKNHKHNNEKLKNSIHFSLTSASPHLSRNYNARNTKKGGNF